MFTLDRGEGDAQDQQKNFEIHLHMQRDRLDFRASL